MTETSGWIDFVQWPAMVVTIAAAWFVASSQRRRRDIGFWLFLLSNLLWIVWGAYAHANALVVLQLALAATNIRGAKRNASKADS